VTDAEWRGSFAIPLTPFDDHDRIDESVLADEIEFCAASGVGGIIVPIMVSEFSVLSEEERRVMIRVPVEAAAGRTPIIVNVAAVNTRVAVSYAEYAQEVGADGVIAMPPYSRRKPDFATVFAYYAAISQAVDVPIWLQNASAWPMSATQVETLCTEIEHVSWVKEEVRPSAHRITALLERNCPDIKGVAGGAGGRNMVAEWARGSKGVVHACQFCDLVQRIWEMLDSGAEDQARDLFEHTLPALVAEGVMPGEMAGAKEIMVRRGVFRNRRMRMEVKPLDEYDLQEIDKLWERIEPYLIWHKS